MLCNSSKISYGYCLLYMIRNRCAIFELDSTSAEDFED